MPVRTSTGPTRRRRAAHESMSRVWRARRLQSVSQGGSSAAVRRAKWAGLPGSVIRRLVSRPARPGSHAHRIPCLESVTDERACVEVGEYEVRLRGARTDARRRQQFHQRVAFRANLSHVSGVRRRRKTQLRQRQSDDGPATDMAPRGAQHGDHTRAPDALADAASCQAQASTSCERRPHSRVKHGRADIRSAYRRTH